MSTKKSQLRSHHHCVFSISLHIVFVTKCRRKCLTKELLTFLNQVFLELCNKWDVDLIEFGGEADHVHLLVEIHPNLTPAKFINNIKTISSRFARRDFDEHLKKFYWKKSVLWTRAYCMLSAGGAPLDTIKRYIENQGRNSSPPKRNRSSEDSLMTL